MIEFRRAGQCLPVIAACAVLVSLGGCEKPLATDRELLQLFHAHRAEYERMVAMLRDDTGVARADLKGAQSGRLRRIEDAGLVADRLAEYHRLMKRTGVENIEVLLGERAVQFDVASRGLVTTGTVKGIVFCAEPPMAVTYSGTFRKAPSPAWPADLDSSERNAFRHMPIEGHWYLFRDDW